MRYILIYPVYVSLPLGRACICRWTEWIPN